MQSMCAQLYSEPIPKNAKCFFGNVHATCNLTMQVACTSHASHSIAAVLVANDVPIITCPFVAQVLHYGNCCFEGMKAYAGVDGRGRLFR